MRSELLTYFSLPFYRAMLERSGFGAGHRGLRRRLRRRGQDARRDLRPVPRRADRGRRRGSRSCRGRALCGGGNDLALRGADHGHATSTPPCAPPLRRRPLLSDRVRERDARRRGAPAGSPATARARHGWRRRRGRSARHRRVLPPLRRRRSRGRRRSSWERRADRPGAGAAPSRDEIVGGRGARARRPAADARHPRARPRRRLRRVEVWPRFLGQRNGARSTSIPGRARSPASLERAVERLGCDLVVFIDVGGDVVAQGHEAGPVEPAVRRGDAGRGVEARRRRRTRCWRGSSGSAATPS